MLVITIPTEVARSSCPARCSRPEHRPARDLPGQPQLPSRARPAQPQVGPAGPLAKPTTVAPMTIPRELTCWARPNELATSAQLIHDSPGPAGKDSRLAPGFEAGAGQPARRGQRPSSCASTREDGEQNISSLRPATPPASPHALKGIPYCPEPRSPLPRQGGGAEQAKPQLPGRLARSAPSPSAPAPARPPSTSPARSTSPAPTTAPRSQPGDHHPAVAGPFDLGTVVVRSALSRRPRHRPGHASTSDPLPHILDGIPLDLRDVRVYVDRPELHPQPDQLRPDARSTAQRSRLRQGQRASVSDRFQVGDCAPSASSPSSRCSLKGGTKRGDYPAFRRR